MPTKNKNPGLKLFTKTWPLKREKKVKNEHNNRPLTATLERPLILDIRLAGKIDMSLVRKEFLNISNLCRLPLVVKKKKNKENRPLSLLSVEICQSKKKKSDTEDDESSVIQSAKNSRSKSHPRSCNRSVIFPLKKNTPVKIISDANNNKMPKVPPRKITSEKLTSVTNPMPMPPVDLLKSSIKQIPEPCRACGRPDQPERFHSHPATPLEVTPIVSRKNNNCGMNFTTANAKKLKENNKVLVKCIVQKPVAIKYQSKNGTQEKGIRSPIKKSNEPTARAILTKHSIKPQNSSVISTNNRTILSSVVTNNNIANSKEYTYHSPVSNNNSKADDTKMSLKETATVRATSGKRTLTCYICGREFGTASLSLHEPKCLEKWERENSKLPPNIKRNAPIKPEGQISQQEWNQRAWESSQASLVPCSNCGRTFYPDRLFVHQKSCKSSPPAKKSSNKEILSTTSSTSMSNTSDQDSSPSSSAPKGPPPTVQCYICGRKFGIHSIEIHERNCLKKWHAENESLPPDMQTAPPVKNGTKPSIPQSQQRSSTSNTVQKESKEERPTSGTKSPLFPCYLCGKLFSVHSIYLHEPQCLKMWQIENEKLPPNKRRQQPLKPDVKFTRSGKINFEATTDVFWKSHLDQLVPCKMCSRTFNPDRVAVHENSCKGN